MAIVTVPGSTSVTARASVLAAAADAGAVTLFGAVLLALGLVLLLVALAGLGIQSIPVVG
ncbi:hypothetical protein [Cellulomonas terrae]|uniref:Uncharacterized protein n=1 Tax=Cellulomonas terrae TaxID=311234 RepID=A0A511JJP3_9CELL|nr:hypothetical protein [Cellulomonas terrae]GEL98176.1 hypothetical protein CTE05_17230 [Cellulomonas terrae]